MEICSRCKKDLSDLVAMSHEGFSIGCYSASGWPDFTDPGENWICDECMFKDPRYVAIYGVRGTNAGS